MESRPRYAEETDIRRATLDLRSLANFAITVPWNGSMKQTLKMKLPFSVTSGFVDEGEIIGILAWLKQDGRHLDDRIEATSPSTPTTLSLRDKLLHDRRRFALLRLIVLGHELDRVAKDAPRRVQLLDREKGPLMGRLAEGRFLPGQRRIFPILIVPSERWQALRAAEAQDGRQGGSAGGVA